MWVHAQASTAVVTLSFLGPKWPWTSTTTAPGSTPRRSRTRPRPDGSGYGLTSLRERVAALAGRLDIESAPGEGTVVAIRLPLVDGPPPRGQPGERP